MAYICLYRDVGSKADSGRVEAARKFELWCKTDHPVVDIENSVNAAAARFHQFFSDGSFAFGLFVKIKHFDW